MKPAERIAVLGAGMAGISAARVLHDAGQHVVVFEKSRGFGGRCATKRWDGHSVDHGAQYFTIRSREFHDALGAACGPSLQTLAAPILDGNHKPLPDEPRYYHAGGNSRLARDLAAGLETRLEQRVENPTRAGERWRVGGELFDLVLSTAPWPQTLSLAGLDPGPSPYHPCLTLVLRYEGAPVGKMKDVYAFSLPDDPVLSWTACENHKTGRVSGGQTLLVAQAPPSFSREHYDRDPAVWTTALRERAGELWEIGERAPAAQMTHRWRNARAFTPPGHTPLPPGWHYAGDAIARSRVEDAWMSGRIKALELLSLRL